MAQPEPPACALPSQLPVLLLEDDSDLATTVADSLDAAGYKVLRASSLTEAKRWIAGAQFPLAVIDICLPDGSGLNALRALKERQSRCEALIITGYASLGDALEAINLGAFGYLQKPVKMDMLLLHLRRAWEKQHLTEMLEQRLREVEGQAAMNLRILEDRMKLVEEKEARDQETIKLYRAIQLASGSLDLEAVVQRIISSIEFSDYTALFIPAQEGTPGTTFTHFRRVAPFHLETGKGQLIRVAMSTGEHVYVPDLSRDQRANPDVLRAGIRSVACLPLKVEQEIQAVLFVTSRKPDAFADKLDLLYLWAEVAAIALRNARHLHATEQARKDWEATFNATSDAIVVMDRDRRIICANRAMAEIVGLTPEELPGKLLCFLAHGHVDRIPACPLEACLESRKEAKAIWTEPHLGNRRLEIKCSPIVEPDGSIRRVVHLMRDVAEPR